VYVVVDAHCIYIGRYTRSEGRDHIRRDGGGRSNFTATASVMFDKHDPYTADRKRFIIKAHTI
jgi:hypothetical protein